MTLPEGTSKTLEAIIHEHLDLIYKVAYMYTQSVEDRNDMAQEIAYQICRSYKNFKGKSKISTWIYRIALNTSLSFHRKKDIKAETLAAYEVADVDEAAEKLEQEKGLRYAIQQLNDADKSMTLLFLDELSYKEIGEITGLSESTVAVKIHRIKKKLKAIVHGKG